MFRALQQKGIIALMVTMIVLAIVTMVTLFTARVIVADQKIYKNVYDRAIAQNAAQAGFDYGYAYFAANSTAVLTTNLSSCASATNTYTLTTTDSPLPNGATFTIQYACVATNTNVISLSATGNNTDNSSTNTVSALLKSISGTFSGYAVIGLQNNGGVNSIDIQDSSLVANNTTGATNSMAGGGMIRLRNSARSEAGNPAVAPYTCTAPKTLSTATPPASGTCSDVSYSNATLNAMSTSDFQNNFIGRLVTDFSSLATVYNFNCSSGGKTFRSSTTFASQGCTNSGSGGTAVTLATATASGGIVYINMGSEDLTIETTSGNPTFNIGSASTPAILVINSSGQILFDVPSSGQSILINGNIYTNTNNYIRLLEGSGTASLIMNGILFNTGDVQIRSGATVNGVVVGGQVDLRTSNSTVNYNATYISNTYGGYYGAMLNPSSGGSSSGYGIVSGSWKDF